MISLKTPHVTVRNNEGIRILLSLTVQMCSIQRTSRSPPNETLEKDLSSDPWQKENKGDI